MVVNVGAQVRQVRVEVKGAVSGTWVAVGSAHLDGGKAGMTRDKFKLRYCNGLLTTISKQVDLTRRTFNRQTPWRISSSEIKALPSSANLILPPPERSSWAAAPLLIQSRSSPS